MDKAGHRIVGRVLIALVCASGWLALAGPASAAPGDIDSTFSGDGIVTTRLGTGNQSARANGVVVQPDGKIVAVGGSGAFQVVRYNRDGSLDTSFSGDGIQTVEAGDYARAVALQPDGKIVVLGSEPSRSIVVRLEPDGSLDSSFSGDGIQTSDIFTGPFSPALAVAVDGDGRIVVTGETYNADEGRLDTAVVRYLTDGSPDPTFSGDGVQTTHIGDDNSALFAVVIQPDGKIVGAGYSFHEGESEFTVVRYDEDGSQDTTFSGDGVQTPPLGGDAIAFSLALAPGGRIVAAGSTNQGSTQSVVVRYGSDGSLDTNFSGDGIQIDTTTGALAEIVAVQPDGKIVAAGSRQGDSQAEFAVVRYLVDGSLDTTFSGDGVQTTAIGGEAGANGVALQPDGKIVAAGYSHQGDHDEFALVRYLGDPTARDDASTVAEDAMATTVDVLANDSSATKITGASDPKNGTVTIADDKKSLTYTPDADYCNDQANGSPDTFTYTIDGTSTATVKITVACVDDPPVAVTDGKTLNEDDPATTIDVLANDTDIDGGTKEIASVAQPTHGTVVVAEDKKSLTYKPNKDFCTQPGSMASFTYTLNGGSTAKVQIVVLCADDAPVAADDAKTVARDAAASPIDVLANDTDVDAGPKEVASVVQPTNGTVAVAEDGQSLTYKPKAGYCNTRAGNTDDFTYKLNGGSQATVRVTVTCPDEPAAQSPSADGPQRPSSTPLRDTTAPIITRSGLSASVFAVDTKAGASRAGRGSRLTFTLSEPATVVFVTEQRVGKRWRKVRIFGRRFPGGRNTLNYSGRIKPHGRQRALRPGRYRLRMRPSDRAGNRGQVTKLGFRISRTP